MGRRPKTQGLFKSRLIQVKLQFEARRVSYKNAYSVGLSFSRRGRLNCKTNTRDKYILINAKYTPVV